MLAREVLESELVRAAGEVLVADDAALCGRVVELLRVAFELEHEDFTYRGVLQFRNNATACRQIRQRLGCVFEHAKHSHRRPRCIHGDRLEDLVQSSAARVQATCRLRSTSCDEAPASRPHGG